MADEAHEKWGCEYCTYKNFEAAKKCTICQALRPPKFITEDQSPDIYQVASYENPSQNTRTPAQTQNSDTSKWTCVKCTYLNWARAKKCAVCMGRKQSTDPGNIAASLEPLTINTSPAPVDNQSGFSKVSPKSGSLSNKTSPKVQETSNNKTSPGIVSKSDNNDKNRLIASNYIKTYNNKWNCVVCTYENWPRSTRCVICGSQRSPSIKDISQTTSDLSPLAGHHSSPPNSPRGAAASMPTNKVLKKSDKNNTTFQKLHDKYSELDWLWLKACLGTYDGDLMAVNAYLTCGGDVARQLTAEEATLIEDGSRFQKGHTLLHIALQSQRQDVVASLLTASVTSQSKKRLPPHTCPDLANEILRTVACSLRQRKGDFPCFFFTEVVTFALPGGKFLQEMNWRCSFNDHYHYHHYY